MRFDGVRRSLGKAEACVFEDSAGEKQLGNEGWKGELGRCGRSLERHTYRFGLHLVSRAEGALCGIRGPLCPWKKCLVGGEVPSLAWEQLPSEYCRENSLVLAEAHPELLPQRPPKYVAWLWQSSLTFRMCKRPEQVPLPFSGHSTASCRRGREGSLWTGPWAVNPRGCVAEEGCRGPWPRLDRSNLLPRPAARWWPFWSVELRPAPVVTKHLWHCWDNQEREGSRISDRLGVAPVPSSHCFRVTCGGAP